MRRLTWLVLTLGVLAGMPAASGSEEGEPEVLPAPPCGGPVSYDPGAFERGPYNEYPDGTANHGTGQCAGAPSNCQR